MHLIIVICILCVAFVFSMAGQGGGMVYVALLSWFGLDLKSTVIPCSLLLVCVTTGSASITHFRKRKVDLSVSAPILASSMLAAPVGSFFTSNVESRTILLIYCFCLGLASLIILFPEPAIDSKRNLKSFKMRLIAGILMGTGIGFAAGLVGFGGSFLLVPLLTFFGIPIKTAAGCSALIVSLSSLSGFLGHLSAARLDMRLIVWILPAAVIGSQVGSLLMQERMKSKRVKELFSLLLWGIIVKTLYGLFSQGLHR